MVVWVHGVRHAVNATPTTTIFEVVARHLRDRRCPAGHVVRGSGRGLLWQHQERDPEEYPGNAPRGEHLEDHCEHERYEGGPGASPPDGPGAGTRIAGRARDRGRIPRLPVPIQQEVS